MITRSAILSALVLALTACSSEPAVDRDAGKSVEQLTQEAIAEASTPFSIGESNGTEMVVADSVQEKQRPAAQ